MPSEFLLNGCSGDGARARRQVEPHAVRVYGFPSRNGDGGMSTNLVLSRRRVLASGLAIGAGLLIPAAPTPICRDVEPLSRDFYVDYADWFRREKGIQSLDVTLRSVHTKGRDLVAVTEGGELIRSRFVVLAVGYGSFAHVCCRAWTCATGFRCSTSTSRRAYPASTSPAWRQAGTSDRFSGSPFRFVLRRRSSAGTFQRLGVDVPTRLPQRSASEFFGHSVRRPRQRDSGDMDGSIAAPGGTS